VDLAQEESQGAVSYPRFIWNVTVKIACVLHWTYKLVKKKRSMHPILCML